MVSHSSRACTPVDLASSTYRRHPVKGWFACPENSCKPKWETKPHRRHRPRLLQCAYAESLECAIMNAPCLSPSNPSMHLRGSEVRNCECFQVMNGGECE